MSNLIANMRGRPITTEYRTNFLPPTEHGLGHLPSFYGSAPHNKSINNDLTTIKMRLGARKLG